VNELADRSMDADGDHSKWVIVARMLTIAESVLVVQRLAALGISAHVPGLAHRQMIGDMFGAPVTLNVHVRADLADLARDILANDEASVVPEEGNDPDDEEQALAPASDTSIAAGRSRLATAALALLFPFGGGHAHVAAGKRSAVLAIGSIGAIVAAANGYPQVIWMVALVVAMDLAGSQWIIVNARRRLNPPADIAVADPYRGKLALRRGSAR
jgi:hypothetical protein